MVNRGSNASLNPQIKSTGMAIVEGLVAVKSSVSRWCMKQTVANDIDEIESLSKVREACSEFCTIQLLPIVGAFYAYHSFPPGFLPWNIAFDYVLRTGNLEEGRQPTIPRTYSLLKLMNESYTSIVPSQSGVWKGTVEESGEQVHWSNSIDEIAAIRSTLCINQDTACEGLMASYAYRKYIRFDDLLRTQFGFDSASAIKSMMGLSWRIDGQLSTQLTPGTRRNWKRNLRFDARGVRYPPRDFVETWARSTLVGPASFDEVRMAWGFFDERALNLISVAYAEESFHRGFLSKWCVIGPLSDHYFVLFTGI